MLKQILASGFTSPERQAVFELYEQMALEADERTRRRRAARHADDFDVVQDVPAVVQSFLNPHPNKEK